MIDEAECRKIVEVVERRLQLLARRGPRWRQPTVTEVLSNTAFLRGVPQRVVEWIRKNSVMRVHPQVCVWVVGGCVCVREHKCVRVYVPDGRRYAFVEELPPL